MRSVSGTRRGFGSPARTQILTLWGIILDDMSRLLYIILICIPTLQCFGQNGNEIVEEVPINLRTPVRYIPIDSISIIRPGQKVKLDFKTKQEHIGPYPPAYPSLRGTRRVPNDVHWYGDSVNLVIDGQNIQFVERKGKTVDYYLFMVECLLSNSYKLGHSLIIPYSTILDTKEDSVLFRLTIELYKQRNKDWKKISSRTKDIWINTGHLDGVLINEIEDE
jgi:hypothetical protein